MEFIIENFYLIIASALIFGFFMAYGIGANDVANAMGTSVGSRALTLTQALVIAAIFEFLGAYLAGAEVTTTIKENIVSPSNFDANPSIFVLGMLSSLLAAGAWLLLATVFGFSYRMRTYLLVNNFVNKSVRTNKLKIFEPHFRRNFIHVRDVVRAIIFTMKNFNKMKKNVYNLGLS